MKIVLSGLQEGMELYLVDAATGWNESSARLFTEDNGEYSLQLNVTAGDQFKLFALCEIDDRIRVAVALKKACVMVTGEGNQSPIDAKKWRVWFLLPTLPTEGEGVWANNVWSTVGHCVTLYPEE